jgi:hypothetical protein
LSFYGKIQFGIPKPIIKMKTIVEKPLKRDNNKDSYMYKNKNDNHFKTNKYIYGCDFNLGRYFFYL